MQHRGADLFQCLMSQLDDVLGRLCGAVLAGRSEGFAEIGQHLLSWGRRAGYPEPAEIPGLEGGRQPGQHGHWALFCWNRRSPCPSLLARCESQGHRTQTRAVTCTRSGAVSRLFWFGLVFCCCRKTYKYFRHNLCLSGLPAGKQPTGENGNCCLPRGNLSMKRVGSREESNQTCSL